MNDYRDPVRQANYLRESLSEERRPLDLFLSGGCPMAIKVPVEGTEAPLIPGIEGITRTGREHLETLDIGLLTC